MTADKLTELLSPNAPLFRHPDDDRVLVYHLGLGHFPAHKFYSALFLIQARLDAGLSISPCGDRSSGSWAMGLAHACHVLSNGTASTRFVSVGSPAAFVQDFVEKHGGNYDVVESNVARKAWTEERELEGYYLPDQHDNEQVITAFEETVAPDLHKKLKQVGLRPWGIIGPVGTGGLLAGTVRGLRRRGYKTRAIGVNVDSSIQHIGPRPTTLPWLKCRGVGAVDEICGTFRVARLDMDELRWTSPFNAAERLVQFQKRSHGCGMSGALTLAVAFDQVVPRIPKGASVVAILPDSPDLYTKEHDLVGRLFPEVGSNV